jgi:ribosomal protein L22
MAKNVVISLSGGMDSSTLLLRCLSEYDNVTAISYHGLDVDDLIVAEAYVGKNLTMKRGRPRARGRYGKILCIRW